MSSRSVTIASASCREISTDEMRVCWQIHRGLTVSVPLLRMWVHCPRASNGLLPRRSNLVGYVRWDAQSDQFPPCQTIIPTAFRSQSELPVIYPQFANKSPSCQEYSRERRVIGQFRSRDTTEKIDNSR